MISALIFALAILPITGLLGYGHSGTSRDYRHITGIQILEDRMNRLLALPFSQILNLAPTSGDGGITGDVLNIPFGFLTQGRDTFQVTASLTRKLITYGCRRIDLPNSTTYSPTNPLTWRFENSLYSRSFPNKAVRVLVTVGWTDNSGRVPQSIQALSYAVDLGE